MNVLFSTAVGLLAADALCKTRRSTSSRRLSMSSASSESSSLPPTSHHHRREIRKRKMRTPRISAISTQASRSTLEASSDDSLTSSSSSSSSSSFSSSSDEDTTDSESSDQSSDSSSDAESNSTITSIRRLCNGRLPRSITRQSQLPDYNTVMTYHITPRLPKTWSSDETSSITSSSDIDTTDTSSPSDIVTTSSDSETSTLSSNSPTPSPLTPLLALPSPIPTSANTPSLHSRLQTFLPALRASNAELEAERLAGRLHSRNIEFLSPPPTGEPEDIKKPYIEMDLGLGVLEERDAGAGESTPVRIKRERSRESSERRSGRRGDEEDALGLLMGKGRDRGRGRGRTPEVRERKRRRVGIEVVD